MPPVHTDEGDRPITGNSGGVAQCFGEKGSELNVRRCAGGHGKRAVPVVSYLMAPSPARLPNLKPTTINPKDSRFERVTTAGKSYPVASMSTVALRMAKPNRLSSMMHLAQQGALR